MTFELWMLMGAGLLGLVHLTAASFTFKAQVGNDLDHQTRTPD